MTTPRDLALALAAVSVIADAAKERKDQLREELRDALDALGADSAGALLPDGTIVGKASLTLPKAKATVTDESAFTGHVASSHPTEVVMRVRESFQRGYLDTLIPGPDGTAVDPSTGEVVPGVRFGDRAAFVSMRFASDGRRAVTDAIRTGTVTLDLTATPPHPALEQA